MIRAGFSRPSSRLHEIAFRQAGLLNRLPKDIAGSIRQLISELSLDGTLARERLDVEAQVARLEDPSKWIRVVGLYAAIPKIDLLAHVAVGIILTQRSQSGHVLLLPATYLALAVSFLGCYALARDTTQSGGGGSKSRLGRLDPRIVFDRLGASASRGGAVLVFVMSRFLAVFLLGSILVAVDAGPSSSVAVLLLSWAPAAYVVGLTRVPTFLVLWLVMHILFVLCVCVGLLRGMKTVILAAFWIAIASVLLVAILRLVTIWAAPATVGLVVVAIAVGVSALAFVTVIPFVVVSEAFGTYRDLRWYVVWTADAHTVDSAATLVQSVSAQRKGSGVGRVLRIASETHALKELRKDDEFFAVAEDWMRLLDWKRTKSFWPLRARLAEEMFTSEAIRAAILASPSRAVPGLRTLMQAHREELGLIAAARTERPADANSHRPWVSS